MGAKRKQPGMAELQAWFGKAISRPLPDRYDGNPLEASAPELGPQAAARLWTRGGFSGFRRLGVYNQQYWFRLISIMQEEYGCVAHLLGLRRFNGWAVRYLEAHPPSSPFLTFLDAEFPAFLAAKYRGKNRAQAIQAAAYERAFSKAVDAPSGEPPGVSDPAELLALRLCLAPHATPLKLDWDFLSFRAECLADDSLEKRIDLRPGASMVMIYRDKNHNMRQASLAPAAFRVLMEMREPAAIPEVFARLEGRLGEGEQAELERNLSAWFSQWVAEGWICREPREEAPEPPARAAKRRSRPRSGS